MVRNAPHLDVVARKEFFGLLGRMPGCKPLSRAPPLALLWVLDISGNEAGDELCSYVLDCVLDMNLGAAWSNWTCLEIAAMRAYGW